MKYKLTEYDSCSTLKDLSYGDVIVALAAPYLPFNIGKNMLYFTVTLLLILNILLVCSKMFAN